MLMSEINVKELVDEIVAYENFIIHIEWQKQAKSLELAQHIYDLYSTLLYQNWWKVYEIFRLHRGSQLSQSSKKYVYNAINHIFIWQ